MGTGQQNIGYNWEEVAARQTPAKPIDPAEESMKFTGNTKIWMDTLQEMFKSAEVNRGQPTTAANPALKDILLSPDKYEPLSFIATDSLFEVARIRKLNVVACPNDEMIIGSGPMPEGQKPSAFLNGIKTYNHDVDISDGWLLVAPKEAIGARAGRADRFALGRYLRTAYKDGRLTLDNRAAFALQSGLEYENFMPMFFLSLLGLLQNGSEFGGDWDTLRLYASLSPMQKRAAVAQQPIPFQALQPLQLEIIRHIVFDSNYSRIQVNYDQEDFADAGEDGVIMGDGLDREPTEILPNGFTGQEMLTIIDTSEAKLFCTPDREDGENFYYGETTMDPSQLAQEQFQQERPEFFPWLSQSGYRRPKYTKFRVGSQRLVQFQVKFTKKASLNLDVRDNQYGGAAVTADKLPENIKKSIQDALARLREQYKNQKPPVYNNGGGGTTTIPPAPRPRK